MLQSWVNGQARETISLEDRGFLYGDGFFTTAAIQNKKVLLKAFHLQRLAQSAKRLSIKLDMSLLQTQLEAFLKEFLLDDSAYILKVIITRGQSARGYHWGGNAEANIILQLFEFTTEQKVALNKKRAEGLRLFLSPEKISPCPALAGIKHLSLLSQVLLSSSVEKHQYDEVLLCDAHDVVREASMANVFIQKSAKDDFLYTPDLSMFGVEGVMKQYIIQKLAQEKIQVRTDDINLAELGNCHAIFLSSCVLGFCPVASVEGVFSSGALEERHIINSLALDDVTIV